MKVDEETLQLILDSAEDLVVSFLTTDRKDDELLRKGIIEKAIEDNQITIEAIVDTFENKLREYV